MQLTSTTCPDLDAIHRVGPAQVHLPPRVCVVVLVGICSINLGVDTVAVAVRPSCVTVGCVAGGSLVPIFADLAVSLLCCHVHCVQSYNKRQGYCCHVQCAQTTKDKDTVAMFNVHRQQKTRILLPCSVFTDNKRQGYCCHVQCAQTTKDKDTVAILNVHSQTTADKDTVAIYNVYRQQETRILCIYCVQSDNRLGYC